MMLKVNCIKRKPKPVTMDKWQDAAREEHHDYLEVQHMLGRNPYNIKETILRNLQKPMPTKFWRAKGPNAMDVNTTQLRAQVVNNRPSPQNRNKPRKPLTDEQRQALRTLGACFYCHNTGHLARDCPEKPKGGQDRRALPGKPPVRPLPPTKNRSAEVEGETIVLTHKNFHEEIMELNEDNRASVVGDLLDQGF